jgi:hypothetical protein
VSTPPLPPDIPRDLTKDDWIQVWTRSPNGEEHSFGGRYDGMSITANGKICIDYLIDPEEGLAMSSYLGWITRIELSDEEHLSREIEPGER